MKTYRITNTNLRIYTNMYGDDDKFFYGLKSVNGGMSYSRLIDTLIMTIGDTDTRSLEFGRYGRFEIADTMEKWVVMRTEHLTKILITGRYDSVDRRLFDSEQLKTLRSAKRPDNLITNLQDFRHEVRMFFEIE
jgi:hypothetical protein